MIFIDQINQRLQIFVQTMKPMELAILGIIPNRRTLRQPLFNVRGNQERGTVTKIFLEFCQENIDARQVEVTKMNLVVGNSLQPLTKVGRLWVAGDK